MGWTPVRRHSCAKVFMNTGATAAVAYDYAGAYVETDF